MCARRVNCGPSAPPSVDVGGRVCARVWSTRCVDGAVVVRLSVSTAPASVDLGISARGVGLGFLMSSGRVWLRCLSLRSAYLVREDLLPGLPCMPTVSVNVASRVGSIVREYLTRAPLARRVRCRLLLWCRCWSRAGLCRGFSWTMFEVFPRLGNSDCSGAADRSRGQSVRCREWSSRFGQSRLIVPAARTLVRSLWRVPGWWWWQGLLAHCERS